MPVNSFNPIGLVFHLLLSTWLIRYMYTQRFENFNGQN